MMLSGTTVATVGVISHYASNVQHVQTLTSAFRCRCCVHVMTCSVVTSVQGDFFHKVFITSILNGAHQLISYSAFQLER